MKAKIDRIKAKIQQRGAKNWLFTKTNNIDKFLEIYQDKSCNKQYYE